MNRRFPLLSAMTLMLGCVGWLLLIPGAFTILMILLPWFGVGAFSPPLSATVGLILIPSGIVFVALSESIRVGIAIEENTRLSSQAFSEMRDAMGVDPQRDKAKTPPKA